jgi:fibronectin-binding autotransporter adhesin
MLDGLLKFMRRLKTSAKQITPLSAQPRLEWLEGRIVPTNTWNGSMSNDWDTAANWSAGQVPGLVGTMDNDVKISLVAPGKSYPTLPAGDSYTITSLNDDAGFTNGILTMAGSLTIAGAGKSSILAYGSIALVSRSSTLDIQESFSWSSPSITGGTVAVDEGGALNVSGGAKTLNSVVRLGNPADAISGTMTLKNMTQNLSLGTNGSITVYDGGFLNFAQSANSNAAGGISQDTSGSITVVGGKVERTGVDTTILTVGMPVLLGTSDGSGGGRFIVDNGASIMINNPLANGNISLLSLGGPTVTDRVEVGVGSTLNVSNGIDMKGPSDIFQVDGSNANSTANVGGNLTIEGGSLLIGVGETNAFTTLNLAGNLIFQTGTLGMSIQGGGGNTGHDSIAVTGLFALNNVNTTLQITDQNELPPTPGFRYVLITAGSTAGADFASVQAVNLPPVNWKHQRTATNYSIWA